MSTDGHTKWRTNYKHCRKFNRLSGAHECYRQTDRGLWTNDRRQTERTRDVHVH